MSLDLLTRRAVRHHLVRLRNTRIAELRDTRWPIALMMHPATFEELLIDSDPAEHHTIDFEGTEFMGIPLITDERRPVGDIAVQWPTATFTAPAPPRSLR